MPVVENWRDVSTGAWRPWAFRTAHSPPRVHLYGCAGRYPADEEDEVMAEYGIEDVTCDDLPRGVLIGMVELYDWDEGDWMLREPERAETPLKPTKHPQPVWFNPFGTRRPLCELH